ncbi:CsbD family protein [Solidesulfovibrio carbinoliphilus subsp. oakridgensis]|uniref:CsbD family protein n=1 Tax=Solidesulfovibrio carbinoliphilus subsp. oakridgensis TaxID=694327 RepID=G7Q5W6_9BACT|nr:CsbD family protein [Solidesulfovibrio carbinoliphilus]EHJ46903.1 CsbD family protein [Solidesulfovibrio carbinoliphilus subsp. oakridgensis]
MDWNRIEGNWKQLKGKVREKWGKLTDDNIDIVAGKREQLAGKIQEAYGIAKDDAERQIDEFSASLKDDLDKDMERRP